MGNRKTALDVALFTIASTAYLGDLRTADLNIENLTVEAKSVAVRYNTAKVAKRKFTFSGQLHRTASSVRKTNLDVSVYSIGGTDWLADLRSANISITTAHQEGSGVGDAYEYPVATGTDVEITAKMLISSSATTTIMTTAGGAVSGLDVTVAITAGGVTVSVPAVLSVVKHSWGVEGTQELDVTLKLRGTPTTFTGPVLAVSAVTGTASVAYSIQTGLESYAGTALILSGQIAIEDGAIISETYELQGQGGPTIS